MAAFVGVQSALKSLAKTPGCPARQNAAKELTKLTLQMKSPSAGKLNQWLYKGQDNGGKNACMDKDKIKDCFEEMKVFGSPYKVSDEEMVFTNKLTKLCTNDDGTADDVIGTANKPDTPLEGMVSSWLQYMAAKAAISKAWTGAVTQKAELKKLLTSLNEGTEVPDNDVDWVMTQGVALMDGAGEEVGTVEMQFAIAAWYTNVGKAGGSSACNLL